MSEAGARGRLVTLADGDEAWEITGVEALRPFLVSLVSAGDHWLFVSTSGGLTAGRRSPDRSLFPYETDDRLHHAGDRTGPITLLRAGNWQWQPLDPRGAAPGRHRVLRKAAAGDWIEFEESAPDLGLVFAYRWATSPRFGLARRARLAALPGASPPPVSVLDGLLNLLPAEVPMLAQQGLSTLVDAYKRAERHVLDDRGAVQAGLYVMEAQLSDRAAPAEALRANLVWLRGLPGATVHLSADAVGEFREGRDAVAEPVSLGRRGAFLVQASIDVRPGPVRWDLVGDVHLDHAAVTSRLAALRESPDLAKELDVDIAVGRAALDRLVASADGQQATAERVTAVHHYANVVFNNLRGGVFADDHRIPVGDLAAFVRERNRKVHERHAPWLRELPAGIDHRALLDRARAAGDPQLERLCMEYLPLVTSRRHGDPSRPWNQFTIQITDEQSAPVYGYEGNWRDIFQNWEALGRSFPGFLEAMVAKFVNASTVDGFNPYRLTREGIDWEVPDPEDPWSNIGYWGDHQVVYLFRLLVAAEHHRPGCLRELLARDLFSYADVPYRIRPYSALLRDAKETIEFDEAADRASTGRVRAVGGDGRLVADQQGEVRLVNLLEKLVVSLLAKLSSFVPDGGIWLNTQRPEWNDANNALVGQGLSVVTLAHLRHALDVLPPMLDGLGDVPVSRPVARWLGEVHGALAEAAAERSGDPLSPPARAALVDRLGEAFSAYRGEVYAHGLGDRVPVAAATLRSLCEAGRGWADHALDQNRREDGLYQSYNLLVRRADGLHVGRLDEMLEGQVAVLASGRLSAREAGDLIDALFASRLYRPDQHSFVLYPIRQLPAFLDRNRLPAEVVDRIGLLAALREAGDRRVIAPDASGSFRFQADLINADALHEVLDGLAQEPGWQEAVAADREAVAAAYEEVFQHHAFTGRSGSMYKYEGLGSVYWHMVSKLLLAVQEAWWAGLAAGDDRDALERLARRYYDIRRGLSFNKTVEEYGAVPSDPYSHTPLHLGAQQPGMTGQVKEEVLTRLGEVGVRVQGGEVSFLPHLLRRRELSREAGTWSCLGPGGAPVEVALPEASIAFTLAQVPVVLTVGGGPDIEARTPAGVERRPGRSLGPALSAALLARAGGVREVRVRVPEEDVWLD